jgi:hypothetical protein
MSSISFRHHRKPDLEWNAPPRVWGLPPRLARHSEMITADIDHHHHVDCRVPSHGCAEAEDHLALHESKRPSHGESLHACD